MKIKHTANKKKSGENINDCMIRNFKFLWIIFENDRAHLHHIFLFPLDKLNLEVATSQVRMTRTIVPGVYILFPLDKLNLEAVATSQVRMTRTIVSGVYIIIKTSLQLLNVVVC